MINSEKLEMANIKKIIWRSKNDMLNERLYFLERVCTVTPVRRKSGSSGIRCFFSQNK